MKTKKPNPVKSILLQRNFPTQTIIPTNEVDYFLEVSNSPKIVYSKSHQWKTLKFHLTAESSIAFDVDKFLKWFYGFTETTSDSFIKFLWNGCVILTRKVAIRTCAKFKGEKGALVNMKTLEIEPHSIEVLNTKVREEFFYPNENVIQNIHEAVCGTQSQSIIDNIHKRVETEIDKTNGRFVCSVDPAKENGDSACITTFRIDNDGACELLNNHADCITKDPTARNMADEANEILNLKREEISFEDVSILDGDGFTIGRINFPKKALNILMTGTEVNLELKHFKGFKITSDELLQISLRCNSSNGGFTIDCFIQRCLIGFGGYYTIRKRFGVNGITKQPNSNKLVKEVESVFNYIKEENILLNVDISEGGIIIGKMKISKENWRLLAGGEKLIVHRSHVQMLYEKHFYFSSGNHTAKLMSENRLDLNVSFYLQSNLDSYCFYLEKK